MVLNFFYCYYTNIAIFGEIKPVSIFIINKSMICNELLMIGFGFKRGWLSWICFSGWNWDIPVQHLIFIWLDRNTNEPSKPFYIQAAKLSVCFYILGWVRCGLIEDCYTCRLRLFSNRSSWINSITFFRPLPETITTASKNN